MNKPTIGRIVHFVPEDAIEDPFAAVITKVHNDTCIDVEVFGLGAPNRYPTSVSFSEEATGGQRWFWPPRV